VTASLLAADSTGPADVVSRLNAVTYTYPAASVPALSAVDIAVRPGEVILITGPSGCGKSTLAYCIGGIIPGLFKGRFEGEVRVLGNRVQSGDGFPFAGRVGIVFQDPDAQLFQLDVDREVAFGCRMLGLGEEEAHQRARRALQHLDALNLAGRRIRTLSGGQKQRVALASVLAMEPEMLILDEPTSALDGSTAEQLVVALRHMRERRPSLTIVLIEHNLDYFLTMISRVVVMEQGRIRQDAPPLCVYSLDNALELERSAVWIPQALACAQAVRGRYAEVEVESAACLDAAALASDLQRRDFALRAASPVVAAPDTDPIVELEGIEFGYDRARPVIDGVSLSVRCGQVIAVLGPNGCGKTTLGKLLVGLLAPTRGLYRLNGQALRGRDFRQVFRHAGYVSQSADDNFLKSTVAEELDDAIGARSARAVLPHREVVSVAERYRLAHLLQRTPLDLSPGEKRRLALATQELRQTEFLVLDEPSVGLDISAVRELRALLGGYREQGRGAVIVSHDLRLLADLADCAVLMLDGRVVYSGALADLFADRELIRLSGIVETAEVIVSRALCGDREHCPPALSRSELVERLERR
jgi:energy-coupling factor transport system ATP-binding protein